MAQYGHDEDNPYEPETTRTDDGLTETEREENDEAVQNLTPVDEVDVCPKPDCDNETEETSRLCPEHMAEVFPERYE